MIQFILGVVFGDAVGFAFCAVCSMSSAHTHVSKERGDEDAQRQ